MKSLALLVKRIITGTSQQHNIPLLFIGYFVFPTFSFIPIGQSPLYFIITTRITLLTINLSILTSTHHCYSPRSTQILGIGLPGLPNFVKWPPYICVSLVSTFLHVTLLMPRILKWLLDF